MSRRMILGIGFALLAAVVLLARSAVIVDESQFVLVTSFGKPVAVYGTRPGEAGLHAKWPWQSARSIDRRLRVADPPSREVITGDKQNLEVASYLVWRVSEPVRFLQSAGSFQAAELRIEERVAAALSDAIGGLPLASLASVDPQSWKLDAICDQVLRNVAEPARRELGVEIVDLRLKRFNFPVEVRSSVFDVIRSERQKVAATLRAEGEAAYQTLLSEADRDREQILAKADAEARRIRAQGEAEATRILNEAHARDPRFSEFLRTLETYEAILDEKSTVILSASSPLLKLLTDGPGEDLLNGKSADPSAGAASPPRIAGSPAGATPEPTSPRGAP